jgi:hypothetical protein
LEQPEELELVKKLVGKWKVELKAKVSNGKVMEGKGKAIGKPVALGYGVYTEVRADISGMEPYAEVDLWSFDRWEKRMHFYSITSTGAVHDHIGSWRDEKTRVFRWEGLYEGKNSGEDVVFTFVSPNEIRVHEIDTSDGQPVQIFDYILTR